MLYGSEADEVLRFSSSHDSAPNADDLNQPSTPILCYATEAPRLPSGTLMNKYKAQAVRCLCMGYSGGGSGAYEALGNNCCQPGYICFDPEGCRLIVTESVRFIVGCFPGLQRTAGGGWRIPAEKIPFSAKRAVLPVKMAGTLQW